MLVECKDTLITSGVVIQHVEMEGKDWILMGRLTGKHIKNMPVSQIAWGDKYPYGSLIKLQTVSAKGIITWQVLKPTPTLSLQKV